MSEVPTMENLIDVRRHGAKGDGTSDDTRAIQSAIDAAGKNRGGVWFSPGVYRSSRLKLHSGVSLVAVPSWGLHHEAGTELHLFDDRAPCLLDLNGTLGVRVRGLTLEGKNLGADIVGIDLDGVNRPQGDLEDTPFLEECCVRHFSGHGVRFLNCWEFVVRNSLIGFNGGHGLLYSRWDGFIFQNMFSANKGYGIAAMPYNGAHAIEGNRIEWNDKGGIFINHGGSYQILGNYIDRSGGPGLHIRGSSESLCRGFSVVGNIFHRSGVYAAEDEVASAHVWLEEVAGLTLTGNVFKAGFAMDDAAGTERKTPSIGIAYQKLRECIVKDNTLTEGATRKLFSDLGGHEAVIVKDNVGGLVVRDQSAYRGGIVTEALSIGI